VKKKYEKKSESCASGGDSGGEELKGHKWGLGCDAHEWMNAHGNGSTIISKSPKESFQKTYEEARYCGTGKEGGGGTKR